MFSFDYGSKIMLFFFDLLKFTSVTWKKKIITLSTKITFKKAGKDDKNWFSINVESNAT